MFRQSRTKSSLKCFSSNAAIRASLLVGASQQRGTCATLASSARLASAFGAVAFAVAVAVAVALAAAAAVAAVARQTVTLGALGTGEDICKAGTSVFLVTLLVTVVAAGHKIVAAIRFFLLSRFAPFFSCALVDL